MNGWMKGVKEGRNGWMNSIEFINSWLQEGNCTNLVCKNGKIHWRSCYCKIQRRNGWLTGWPTEWMNDWMKGIKSQWKNMTEWMKSPFICQSIYKSKTMIKWFFARSRSYFISDACDWLTIYSREKSTKARAATNNHLTLPHKIYPSNLP